MTNQHHPIIPPPELVEDWIEIAKPLPQRPPNPGELATLAARWGADQELEACCEWIHSKFWIESELVDDLRLVRRKPPSLKEQAKAELDRLIALIPTEGALAMAEPIRRALESLPDPTP